MVLFSQFPFCTALFLIIRFDDGFYILSHESLLTLPTATTVVVSIINGDIDFV